MTLRIRLLLAALLSTLVLVAVLTGVGLRQRSVLTDQLDDQLSSLGTRFERAATVFDTAGSGDTKTRFESGDQRNNLQIGEIYAAVVINDETTVFSEPASQPGMRVPLDTGDLAAMTNPGEPFTTDVLGVQGRARAIAVQVDSETWILGAISTEAVEDAQRQLFLTGAAAVAILAAGLAMIIWWVDRLGIRPIIEVTRAAEDVAAGRTGRRVEHPAETTEAGRLGAAFNTMLDERQASEDRQRRFVADASHELRTPLTTLRGYAALYESGGLAEPDQVADAMRRIKGEAARMETLVDDLLTLAGLDDHQPLEIEPLDLTRLLADIAADASAIQPSRPVSTDAIKPDLLVSADVHQLTKALTTIVSNVLRHTPTDTSLILRAESKRGRINMEISDTGPGIEAEHVDRLFDRFYRVEAGRSRAKGGSGLGLPIAKAIIEAHQGTIKIVSSTHATSRGDGGLATGTTVSITLPLS